MRQSLRRQLLLLAAGEFVATVVFAFVLYNMRERFGVAFVGALAWLGYGTLALILLQRTVYWLVALRRVGKSRAQSAHPLAFMFARMAYRINAVILAVFPLMCAIGTLRGETSWREGDPWLGLGLYLFALIEFIHYFVVKIVRSERDRAGQTRWQPSRFRRELAR